MTRAPGRTTLLVAVIGLIPSIVSAQVVESVGARALGMGGAFVAVANDSTATWWNPAALAAGPFLDVAVGWSTADIDGSLPAHSDRATSVTAAIPPFGFSYYRLHITDIGQFRTIAGDGGDREDRRVAVPDWSLSASQFGATLVHTLVSDLHVGTTLKYVWAKGLQGEVTGPETLTAAEWLDLADNQGGGGTHGGFDMDIGVLAVHGPLRFGGVVRNLLEAELGPVTIPRQARVGVAFDAAQVSTRPLMVSVDADLLAYSTLFGDRRVVAVGGEGWGLGRRLGVRAGARFNTVGLEEQAYTAGASVAVRSGMFVDGYVVFGGAYDEGGWGVAARASF